MHFHVAWSAEKEREESKQCGLSLILANQMALDA